MRATNNFLSGAAFFITSFYIIHAKYYSLVTYVSSFTCLDTGISLSFVLFTSNQRTFQEIIGELVMMELLEWDVVLRKHLDHVQVNT